MLILYASSCQIYFWSKIQLSCIIHLLIDPNLILAECCLTKSEIAPLRVMDRVIPAVRYFQFQAVQWRGRHRGKKQQ